jgi:lysophospholipase L1-like esterase
MTSRGVRMRGVVVVVVVAMTCVLACVLVLSYTSYTSHTPSGTPPSGPPSSPQACGAAASFPPAPAWAAPSGATAAHVANTRVVASANAAGQCLDVVLYGDSITAFLGRNPGVLRSAFGNKRVAALGVGGNTIEQLAHRITRGDERLARAPRAAVFNIGVNNLIWAPDAMPEATTRLSELLRWMKAAYPSTTLVLMALLPASPKFTTRIAATNRAYRAMADRLGVTFVDCGAGMDPSDTRLYSDGLHPTAAGHAKVLACLSRNLLKRRRVQGTA